MVTIKHKVTIKTKTAQEETPAAVESSVVTIKRKQPEVAPESKSQPKSNPKPDTKPVTPTAVHEKKSNTGKVVGGIIATAAVLAGIYFLGIKDNGGDNNNGTTIEQAAQAGGPQESGNPETSDESNTGNGDDAANTTDTETTKPSEVSETPVTTVNDNVSAPSKVDKKKADKPSKSETSAPQQTRLAQATQPSTSTDVASVTVSGDVEENARRVIRGDFGNGKIRKDKLGASYPEIQGRVNEMYRQGLVH